MKEQNKSSKRVLKEGDPKHWKSIMQTFKNLSSKVKQHITIDNVFQLNDTDLKGTDPLQEVLKPSSILKEQDNSLQERAMKRLNRAETAPHSVCKR